MGINVFFYENVNIMFFCFFFTKLNDTLDMNSKLPLGGSKSYQLELRCLNIHLSYDDENDVMRMVRGRPKYTLSLILICACM